MRPNSATEAARVRSVSAQMSAHLSSTVSLWLSVIRSSLDELKRCVAIGRDSSSPALTAACGGTSSEKIVMAREGKLLVTAFHPELTDDYRIHKYFIEMVMGNRHG